MTSPIDPTPEDSRFFAELSALEPSSETDQRILEAAGFELGRQGGLERARRVIFQGSLWAAMVVVTVLVVLLAPESGPGIPGESSSPSDSASPRPGSESTTHPASSDSSSSDSVSSRRISPEVATRDSLAARVSASPGAVPTGEAPLAAGGVVPAAEAPDASWIPDDSVVLEAVELLSLELKGLRREASRLPPEERDLRLELESRIENTHRDLMDLRRSLRGHRAPADHPVPVSSTPTPTEDSQP